MGDIHPVHSVTPVSLGGLRDPKVARQGDPRKQQPEGEERPTQEDVLELHEDGPVTGSAAEDAAPPAPEGIGLDLTA